MTGGNIFGLDPATGLKILVDRLDEYIEDRKSESNQEGYSIPVSEDRDSFSKPENENQLTGGDNNMTEGLKPEVVDELNTLSAEAPEEYSELARSAERLAGAATGDAYQKTDLDNEAQDFVSAYEDVLEKGGQVAEERDFAVRYGETVARVATGVLNADTAALDRLQSRLEESYSDDDFDVDLYGFGDEEERALDDLEDAATDAIDRMSDVGRWD